MSVRQWAEYAARAETRAVEEGHRAFVLEDGAIRVASETSPDKSYRVTFRSGLLYAENAPEGTLLISFSCSCPAGQHRRDLPVPCKHAALAGRRLEREGLAKWHEGLWFDVRPVTAKTTVEVGDPFAAFQDNVVSLDSYRSAR